MQPDSANSAQPISTAVRVSSGVRAAQMRLKPTEEVGVLARRQIARQNLIQMVVAVDHPGKQDVTPQVKYPIGGGRQFRGESHLLDDAIAGKKACVFDLPAPAIHSDDHVRILCEQRRHGVSPGCGRDS